MNIVSFQINKKDILSYWVPIGVIGLILFIAYPLTLSILCGYLLYPTSNFFRKKLKLPIIVSVLITEIIILSSFLLFVYFIFQSLVTLIPLLHEHLLYLPFDDLQKHPIFLMFEDKFQELLNTILNNLLVNLTHLPTYVFEVLLFSIGLFFSLYESTKDRLWFLIYFPVNTREFFHRVVVKSSEVVNSFLGVEVKLLLITFILLSIGFSVLGLHNPIKNAFLISLVDSIPFLGTGIILIPMSIYFFLLDAKLFGSIILLLYIFVQLTRHIVDNLLWSASMQIKAVHVFFLSAAAVLIFGFVGILFSPFIYLIANKWGGSMKTSSR